MSSGEHRYLYSVDNNTLMTISAYFRPRTFPRLWALLDALAEAGRLYVCEEVANEYAPRETTAVRVFIDDRPNIVIGLHEFQDWFATLMADAPAK